MSANRSGTGNFLQKLRARIQLARNVRELEKSGLFDPHWYHSSYPELTTKRSVAHFVQTGGRAGYNPGPGFDCAFYLASHPDVEQAGINPVLHYIRSGRAEGRLPLPASALEIATLDPNLAQQAREILDADLFDRDWYRSAYPETPAERGLAHFVQTGGAPATIPARASIALSISPAIRTSSRPGPIRSSITSVADAPKVACRCQRPRSKLQRSILISRNRRERSSTPTCLTATGIARPIPRRRRSAGWRILSKPAGPPATIPARASIALSIWPAIRTSSRPGSIRSSITSAADAPKDACRCPRPCSKLQRSILISRNRRGDPRDRPV